MGYIADAGALPIYQEKFIVRPPMGCLLNITLGKYVKINIHYVNYTN